MQWKIKNEKSVNENRAMNDSALVYTEHTKKWLFHGMARRKISGPDWRRESLISRATYALYFENRSH